MADSGRPDGDRLKEPEKNTHFSMNLKNTGEKRKSSEHEAEPFPKKIGFGFSISKTKLPTNSEGNDAPKKTVAPIKLSLGTQKPKESQPTVKKTSAAVAKAFNADDESDEEEMPPEAKMRMRNVGRETPTAAGPNSFGKGKLGFCDRQKIIQKELQQQIEEEGKGKQKKKAAIDGYSVADKV